MEVPYKTKACLISRRQKGSRIAVVCNVEFLKSVTDSVFSKVSGFSIEKRYRDFHTNSKVN